MALGNSHRSLESQHSRLTPVPRRTRVHRRVDACTVVASLVRRSTDRATRRRSDFTPTVLRAPTIRTQSVVSDDRMVRRAARIITAGFVVAEFEWVRGEGE